FWGLNRNKRGIGVDLQNPAGRDLLERLALRSDVVVENFRPGVLDRHGLGYEQLRTKNPRLVYCSITAFGPKGPLAQKPGMDLILQATGGLMGHTGETDGPPIKAAPPVADITSGIYAAYGILGALYERERSGVGQRVEESAEVVKTLNEIFATNDVAHWIALLEENDIPTCRVNRLEEILDHPQIAANGALAEGPHPTLGRYRTLTPPVKLGATPSHL